MKHDKFKRGSGCFSCKSCGRQTRDTGDNGELQLCSECYEMAGIENSIADGNATDEEKALWHQLKAACISKGGTL